MVYVMNYAPVKNTGEEFMQAVLALNQHASALCPDATYGVLRGIDGPLNRICLTVKCNSFAAWEKQYQTCNQDAKFRDLVKQVGEFIDGPFERHIYEVIK
jgi:hypothetical protein